MLLIFIDVINMQKVLLAIKQAPNWNVDFTEIIMEKFREWF